MRRLTKAAAVAALALALASGQAAAACPSGWGAYGGFSDVPETQWSFEYIRQVASSSIAWQSGQAVWTRVWNGLWWEWAWVHFYYPTSALQNDHWRGGVKRAFAVSLPCVPAGGSVTRANAASELIRAAGLGWVADQMTWTEAQTILSSFPDHAATPAGVYRDVAVAVWYGIVQGVWTPSGVFLQPNNTLTREQGAALLARAGLARVRTDKTSYFRTESIQVFGAPRTIDTIVSETAGLHRDDHTLLSSWTGRNHTTGASGLQPGRYFVVYTFQTARQVLRWCPWTGFWWQTITNTWRSTPAVFNVVNRTPAVTMLAPQGDQTDRQPPIRLRATDADGDTIRQLQVQVATDTGFVSLAWSGTFNVTLASGGEWSVQPSPLPAEQALHVRAGAWDGLNWGSWSAPLSFAIRFPVPPTARWLAPSDGARVFYEGSLEISFDGTAQTGAQLAEYELQAAASSGFSPLLAHHLAAYSGGTARVTLTGLPGGGVCLRIRVRDNRGLWSSWAATQITLVGAVSPGAVPPPAWPGDGTGPGDPQNATERTRLTR